MVWFLGKLAWFGFISKWMKGWTEVRSMIILLTQPWRAGALAKLGKTPSEKKFFRTNIYD